MRKDIKEFRNKLTYTVVTALIDKLFKAGWTEEDVYRVGHHSDDILRLSELIKVARGEATMEIDIIEHVVDSNQKPDLHYDHVMKNFCYGKLNLSKTRLGLFIHPEQLQRGNAYTTEIDEAVTSLKMLNAAVMVYLLKYQSLIPKEWQNKERIYFYDTIFGHERDKWVRYIFYNKNTELWDEGRQCLSHWELGNRHSFEANDAIAIIETRKRKK